MNLDIPLFLFQYINYHLDLVQIMLHIHIVDYNYLNHRIAQQLPCLKWYNFRRLFHYRNLVMVPHRFPLVMEQIMMHIDSLKYNLLIHRTVLKLLVQTYYFNKNKFHFKYWIVIHCHKFYHGHIYYIVLDS